MAWFPVALRYTGLAGVIFGALFWAATHLLTGQGVVEPSLLALFGSMLGLGEVADAFRELNRPQREHASRE